MFSRTPSGWESGSPHAPALSPPMLLLWSIESLASFLVFCMLLGDGPAALPMPSGGGTFMSSIGIAAAAALIVATTTSAVGLYRRDTLLRTRKSIAKAITAAAASLPALWLVGRLAHLDLAALLGHGASGPLRLLAGWSAVLLATRSVFRRSLHLEPWPRGAARNLDERDIRERVLDAARVEAALRRASDLVFATGLMVATLPLMLVTAVLIRLDSPGPVLYRQERVGLNGRVFTLLKFRSMCVDAESGGPVWAARRDARITAVGSLIRRVRIDELPQVLNIFRGEMSLIGPRPERPHFVAQLAEAIPGYRDRALVKPGLTGWAQVNLPYGASVEDAQAKLAYDLYYVKHRSFLLDATILLATVRVVLFQEGAR